MQVADGNKNSGNDLLSDIVEYSGDLVAYSVLAYVVGFESEFGYVGVRPCNGGLTRIY